MTPNDSGLSLREELVQEAETAMQRFEEKIKSKVTRVTLREVLRPYAQSGLTSQHFAQDDFRRMFVPDESLSALPHFVQGLIVAWLLEQVRSHGLGARVHNDYEVRISWERTT